MPVALERAMKNARACVTNGRAQRDLGKGRDNNGSWELETAKKGDDINTKCDFKHKRCGANQPPEVVHPSGVHTCNCSMVMLVLIQMHGNPDCGADPGDLKDRAVTSDPER